jgi:cysteine desulfurase/selenocysteine lyase
MADTSAEVRRRVYLDNAATSWPKSSAALQAAETFSRHCGATAGRGAYSSGLEADRWLSLARTNLSRLIKSEGAASVAICSSGTHALNAALWGLIRAGDHVITTEMEHNSCLRPLKNLESHWGVKLSCVPCDADGFVDPQHAELLVGPETKWFVIGHASNVTGRIQDIARWSELAHRSHAQLIVDASQTIGYIPIDLQASGIDVLAAAGHKGLRALAGTGLLVLRSALQTRLRPLMFGGTGFASEQLSDSQCWPQSVEVGNLNMPGVVSLAVAAAEAEQQLAANSSLWHARLQQLVDGLRGIDGVELIGWEVDRDIEKRIPVVSLRIDGWEPHDVASVLDSFGIEARAGWHCAALVHQHLGTAQQGGTLRLSPGISTTVEEIDFALSVLRQLLS